MSDSVRKLVVSLYLDSEKFDKAIKIVNNEIKLAESEFKLASAGSTKFEKSLAGMNARAAQLKSTLKSQNEMLGMMYQKLDALDRQQLRQNNAYYKASEAYREAQKTLSAYKKEIETTEKLIQDARYAGDELITEGLEAKLKEQEKTYKAQEKAVLKLGAAQDKYVTQMGNTENRIKSTKAEINLLNAEIVEEEKELEKLNNTLYKHGVAMEEWAQTARTASETMSRAGSTLTKSVTAPILAAAGAAAKAGIDYEDAFASVRKTVTATGDDTEAFFSQLSDSVIDMSKRLATGAEDISAVMAMAGQLGIANSELSRFTETVVRLAMSTDMAAEDGASTMARFANITGMAQGLFSNLGSTLVDLGNNFATTESEIMDMATRIASAGSLVGLSEPQILGFAAALSSLGLEAESGGTAFSKALRKMETAVATGSAALDDFARVAGMTSAQFAELWENNPADAFQAFIVGLGRMNDEGIGAIATLSEIGLTEVRLSDTLLRSANATDLISDALNRANTAWSENNALTKESDTRLQTTASRLTNIKNSLIAVGIEFAGTMAPEMDAIVNRLGDAVEWFGQLDDATRRSIVSWGIFAASAGPFMKLVGGLGKTVTGAVSAFGKLSQSIGLAQIAFAKTGSAASALVALLGPGGTLALGIAAATAAIAGLIIHFNRLEAAKPDLSIDKSQLDSYKIDPKQLETDVDVNTRVSVSGDILNLKSKFISILNDGVPENQEIQDEMQSDIDDAVGEVYRLLNESVSAQKASLDEQFSGGLIDESTYNTAISKLSSQSDALKTDLTDKAAAVTGYVSALCANNRAMTDDEIETLNSLLDALSLTVQEAEKAAGAQANLYQMAYDKTRLGMGTAADQQKALEYIELEANQKIAEIEAQKQALESVYAAVTEGGTDQEKTEAFAQMNEQTDALNAQIDAINRYKAAAHAGIDLKILNSYGISLDDLSRYVELVSRLNAYSVETEGGFGWGEMRTVHLFGLEGVIKEMDAIIAKLDESGALKEGSPLLASLATLTDTGVVSEDSLTNTYSLVEALARLAENASKADEAMSILTGDEELPPVKALNDAPGEIEGSGGELYDAMKGVGAQSMKGLESGVMDGISGVKRAFRQAARAGLAAAKNELQIKSPSRVFEKEVGAMAIKGLGKGALEESKNQAKAMKNAARYLTGEAAQGAQAAAYTTKNYKSEQSVNVTVDTLVVRDDQDIQMLAREIAAQTRIGQRGRGYRMA